MKKKFKGGMLEWVGKPTDSEFIALLADEFRIMGMVTKIDYVNEGGLN